MHPLCSLWLRGPPQPSVLASPHPITARHMEIPQALNPAPKPLGAQSVLWGCERLSHSKSFLSCCPPSLRNLLSSRLSSDTHPLEPPVSSCPSLPSYNPCSLEMYIFPSAPFSSTTLAFNGKAIFLLCSVGSILWHESASGSLDNCGIIRAKRQSAPVTFRVNSCYKYFLQSCPLLHSRWRSLTKIRMAGWIWMTWQGEWPGNSVANLDTPSWGFHDAHTSLWKTEVRSCLEPWRTGSSGQMNSSCFQSSGGDRSLCKDNKSPPHQRHNTQSFHKIL